MDTTSVHFWKSMVFSLWANSLLLLMDTNFFFFGGGVVEKKVSIPKTLKNLETNQWSCYKSFDNKLLPVLYLGLHENSSLFLRLLIFTEKIIHPQITCSCRWTVTSNKWNFCHLMPSRCLGLQPWSCHLAI